MSSSPTLLLGDVPLGDIESLWLWGKSRGAGSRNALVHERGLLWLLDIALAIILLAWSLIDLRFIMLFVKFGLPDFCHSRVQTIFSTI